MSKSPTPARPLEFRLEDDQGNPDKEKASIAGGDNEKIIDRVLVMCLGTRSIRG